MKSQTEGKKPDKLILMLVEIAKDIRSSIDSSLSRVSVSNPIYAKEEIIFYGKILYLLGFIEALGERNEPRHNL